jgi:hypothetical protein
MPVLLKQIKKIIPHPNSSFLKVRARDYAFGCTRIPHVLQPEEMPPQRVSKA